MTFSEIRRLLSPTTWIAIAVVALLAIAIVWGLFTENGRARTRAAQAQLGMATAQGQAGAARNAVDVVSSRETANSKTDQQTRESENEIRTASDSERDAVAIARICMRDSARGLPECASMRAADP